MNLQLSGKLAVVTGSTAGIGLAIGSTLCLQRDGEEGLKIIEIKRGPFSPLRALDRYIWFNIA